jgi:hypothetical protein
MNIQQKAALLALGLAVVAPASQAATIAITNGSFETPVQVTDGYSYYGTASTSAVWDGVTYNQASVAGGSGVAATGSAFVGATPLDGGTQVGFVQETGSLTLTADWNGVGNNLFNFSFAAAERYAESTHQTLNVLLNGVLIDTVSNLSNSAFTAFNTGDVTLNVGTNNLTFVGTSALDATALLDAVTGSQIPEPASIALLAAGMFGFAASRRKKSA